MWTNKFNPVAIIYANVLELNKNNISYTFQLSCDITPHYGLVLVEERISRQN